MERSSQALLDLEKKSSSNSSLESKLVVCKNDRPSQTGKDSSAIGRPTISSVPQSQFLGKVKDFLGVISDANKRLQLDAKEKNSEDYDIEVLTGNETEYIEMDLMLGVADLHTPEAVAAAESAIAGSQPVIPLAASSTDSGGSSDDSGDSTESEYDKDSGCSNDEQNEDSNNAHFPPKSKISHPKEVDSSSAALRNARSKKRPKIVELP